MTELRYTVRTLFKKPGLALAAIVCLALGMGANTAIYTVVNAVERPLPRLVSPSGMVETPRL